MVGNRGPVNVTIVQVGRGNGGGGDGGNDLLRLEPPSDLRPVPSPLSDTSATLQSDNNDTLVGGERKNYRNIPIILALKKLPILASPIFTFDTKKVPYNFHY